MAQTHLLQINLEQNLPPLNLVFLELLPSFSRQALNERLVGEEVV